MAEAAVALGCPSVAFTYNDPVIFLEYAIDVAKACRARGVRTVAVTAGYIDAEPRVEFYEHMDAANVDLKAFTERFYHEICAGHLAPVLETLEYLKHQTHVWFEITNLMIPGLNDSEDGDRRHDALGRSSVSVPTCRCTSPRFIRTGRCATGRRRRRRRFAARAQIAIRNGVQYAYTGNVHDVEGGTT